MKILSQQELKSFEHFFQMSQRDLLKTMTAYLKTKYNKVIATKDYVIAVGDIPVGIVAHLDTVFKTQPQDIYYDRKKNIMWSPDGLGADDRAGVYAAIWLIRQKYRPTIIFTTDEEMGGIGAMQLIKDYPEPPTELKYLIELDRRGSIDCVFYDCDNYKFEEYVEQFGFVSSWGTFSDISEIAPAWKIAAVNLSIGYESEHTYQEILNIGHMINTINKVKNMLEDVDNIETFEYIPMYYGRYGKFGGYSKSSSWNWEDDWSYDPSYGVDEETWNKWVGAADLRTCISCGTRDYKQNLLPLIEEKDTTCWCCTDCFVDGVNAKIIDNCKNCNKNYLTEQDDKGLCANCRKESINNGKTI